MKKFLFVAFAVCLSITATAQAKDTTVAPVQSQQQEMRLLLSLTVPQLNALYDGLKKSSASYQDIQFLLSLMDGQVQFQIDQLAKEKDVKEKANAKPQTKKP